MEATVLRLARPHERAALEGLQWHASLASGRHSQALLDNPDAIDLPAAHIEKGWVTLAERGGSVAGFAVVLPRDDGDVELDGLFVEPASVRTGVGLALVQAAVQGAQSRGAAWLHVVAGPDGMAFYLACGFDTVGEPKPGSDPPGGCAGPFRLEGRPWPPSPSLYLFCA